MGNIASATLYSRQKNSLWKFTASDVLLDQMEKQTLIIATPSCIDFITHYCTIVLSTLAMLLMVPLKQPQKAPVLVDAVCQTEHETCLELTINRGWQPYHVNSKCAIDDDCHSCTTEATDLFTDTETDAGTNTGTGADSDEFEDNLDDDLDDEWDDANSSAGNLSQTSCDTNDTHCTCNCETDGEQLLLLNAIKCAKNEKPSSIYVKEYLCSCGECPQYKQIAHDVAMRVKEPQYNFLQKQNIIRLLQAFSTYNEVMGYRTDMIPTAYDCLRVWCGDEDKAFESFVALYDELPRLCDTACGD
ncbi:unnamed protein product [Peronospora destructor]|uniref:Rab-GAP TBC domain-containing protein n=1 Tax=Peronospora destructor TaxID=86335 RepID=A0AAV0UJ94_9STRA|nr:unnamed protein product [Peronospora destructor]